MHKTEFCLNNHTDVRNTKTTALPGYVSDYNVYAGTIPTETDYVPMDQCLITIYATLYADAYYSIIVNGITISLAQASTKVNDMRYVVLNAGDTFRLRIGGGTVANLEIKRYTK